MVRGRIGHFPPSCPRGTNCHKFKGMSVSNDGKDDASDDREQTIMQDSGRSFIDADTIVVGGGLAGLSTAALIVRARRSVMVLEQADALGGRAATHVRKGVHWNLGAHALYCRGRAFGLFRDLGVPFTGRVSESKPGPPHVRRGAISSADRCRIALGIEAFERTGTVANATTPRGTRQNRRASIRRCWHKRLDHANRRCGQSGVIPGRLVPLEHLRRRSRAVVGWGGDRSVAARFKRQRLVHRRWLAVVG